MSLNFLLILISTLALSSAQSDEPNSTNAETCMDLCKSCNGVATFENNRCECNIEQSVEEGAECVLRMKRKASAHGLDVVSCDLSTDKRFTRCLLGSKFEKNDIDQVAKYFMQDGPITGSIFLAPPYTHPNTPDTVQNSKTDCADQPSLFILNPIPTTTQRSPVSIVSSPQSAHIVYSSYSPHTISSPQSQPIVSNPQSHHFASTIKNENVGTPKIITQPKETMVTPKINHVPPMSIESCLGKSTTNINSPIVGNTNPNLNQDGNNTSNFFQILSQQLSQPMFGIPQAIQTVSQTPGFSDWVSTPVNLINTFLQRLNENSNQILSTRKGSDSANVKAGIPKIVLSNSNTNGISPIVGTQFPTFNYNYPPIGSPLISLIHPAMNIPSTPHISYIPQMQSAMQSGMTPARAPTMASAISPSMSPTMPVIHGSIVGSMSPINSFMTQVPTAFVVGTPLGLPYYTNYNTDVAPSSLNILTNLEESPTSFIEHKVEPSSDENISSSFLQTLKKICKKSIKEEIPVKKVRDIKNIPEYIINEIKFQEMKRQVEQVEKEKQPRKKFLDIPKIDRATTKNPILENMSGQNINLKKGTKENENFEKTKIEESITEQFNQEKEYKIKSKPIIKKFTQEQIGT